MRRWTLSLGMGSGLVACLVIGAAGNARAATLDFTGTLTLQLSTLPLSVGPGAGAAQLTDDGSLHLLSFALAGGSFGPISLSIAAPFTAGGTIQSVRVTSLANLPGSFGAISGGPPGGGTMGLAGMAKICLIVANWVCQYGNIPFPLTPSTGGAGFGIGGTQTIPGGVALTYQHAPWTIGQPVMTLHTPNSTISTQAQPWVHTANTSISTWPQPGGFAHGPASFTSSTAQVGGALQLVTITKAFTSLTTAFPEMLIISTLRVNFVPEPGTLLLLGLGVVGLAAAGRWRSRH